MQILKQILILYTDPGRPNVQDMRWSSRRGTPSLSIGLHFLNGVFEVVGIEKYSEQFGLRSPRLSYLSRFVSLFIHEEKMRKMEYLLACSGDKIQSFQFDKKETSASKLLMEFTRRMWFGEGKYNLYGNMKYENTAIWNMKINWTPRVVFNIHSAQAFIVVISSGASANVNITQKLIKS